MKGKVSLLALAALALSSFAVAQTPPVGTATTININWSAYTPTASWPLCTATVKVNCVNGTAGTITSPAGGSPIPLTIAANATTAQYKPGGPLYLGSWNVSLWFTALDSSGNTIPVCAATPVPPCSTVAQTTVTYAITPVVIITGPTGTTVQFQ